jgi:uncharacterized repeat protein (TIGR01451 family)
LKTRTNILVAFLFVVALSTAALAQAKADLVKVDLKQFKVTQVNGKEDLQAASSFKPGEVIEYVATYHNTGKAAVKNVNGTIPVPVGTEYLPDANLKAPDMAAGADKSYAPLPLKRKVMRNGVETEELLPYSEYRFLRWNIGQMAPDATAVLKARVKIAEHK